MPTRTQEVRDLESKRIEHHRQWRRYATLACAVVILCAVHHTAGAQQLLGDPIDISQDFVRIENTYFLSNRFLSCDAATGAGTLEWKRFSRRPTYSFNKMDKGLSPVTQNEEFPTEYDASPATTFTIEFVSPRTIRLRINTAQGPIGNEGSLMLVGPPSKDNSWKVEQTDKAVVYKSSYGSVTLIKDPWEIQIRDASGKLLTGTQSKKDLSSFSSPLPFSFVRRAADLSRSVAATFSLSPDEKIFGCGESFTRLNKRGQKVVLYMRDAMGVQTPLMYKPIPFFMSSNGYGMFPHTSTPVTLDIGQTFDNSNVVYVGEDALDLFIFLGSPREILSEYTALTGRSPVPPLWSAGTPFGQSPSSCCMLVAISAVTPLV